MRGIKLRKGIGRITLIAVIVVIVVVAVVAGSLAYLTSRHQVPPMTSTTTIFSTVTSTSTVMVTSTPSTTTTSTTVTTPALVSSTPVIIGAVSASHPDMAAWALLESNLSWLTRYDPNAKVQDFPGGSGDVIHALETGSIQIGIAGTDAIAVAISHGAPLVIVATYRVTPAIREVLVSPTSGITNITQLNGKTMALSKPGSLDAIAMLYLSSIYHINLTPVYVGSFSAQVASVVSGSAASTNVAIFDAASLVSNGTLRSILTFEYPYPMFSVVTTRSFAQQHPDAIRAVLAGLEYANSIYDSNPNNLTLNFISSYYHTLTPTVRDVLLHIVFSTNGAINVTALNQLLTLYRQLKIITNNTLTVSDLYITDFSPVVS